jgi:excisionase family DNA binding protein
VSRPAPILSAPVGGFSAFVLARVLEDALPARIVSLQRQAETGRIHPDLLAELTHTWAAIGEAARQWAERRASADASTEAAFTETPARWAEIDTDRAAGLLGVTPSRVRQLVRSGELNARKVGRSWLVDRTSIDLKRECDSGHLR